MMKKYIFLIALLPSILLAQHTITGTFTPEKDYSWIILYKLKPASKDFVKSTKLKEDGSFTISLDPTATPGMYRVVYKLPEDVFNFDIIYNAKEDVVFTFNKETGVKYQSSEENILSQNYTRSMSVTKDLIGQYYRNKKTDTLRLLNHFNKLSELQATFESKTINTIANHFIKATRPYIPDNYLEVKDYLNNYKSHFFDHVDYNNAILQSSGFLIDHTLNYVFGMAFGDSPDKNTLLINNINDVYHVMDKALISSKIKKKILKELWQQMIDDNKDKVANYILDSSLMELATSLKDKQLLKDIHIFKNLQIGSTPPNITWQNIESGKTVSKSLSDLNTAEKYVVIFWSSTCSHCKEHMPKIHDYIKNLNNTAKIKVIAVALEEDENDSEWATEILKYPDFTHISKKGNDANLLAFNYNISSTPSFFILDANKKIVAKPDKMDDLKSVLSN